VKKLTISKGVLLKMTYEYKCKTCEQMHRWPETSVVPYKGADGDPSYQDIGTLRFECPDNPGKVTSYEQGDRVMTLPFSCIRYGHKHWVPEWAVPTFHRIDGANVLIEDLRPTLYCTEKPGEKAEYYWLNGYRPVEPGQDPVSGEKT